jgi:S1-C subfamily serine protease
VYLSDGTRLDTKVTGRSLDADIAILKVDRNDLPVAVGTKRKVAFGDLTVMIDASKPTRGPDITVGVVTKETTSVTRGEDTPPVYGVIQTTTRASVTPRSAGSLLIDSGGTVIGFITSRAEPPASGTPSVTTTPLKAVAGTTVKGASADEGNAALRAARHFAWDIATAVDQGIVKPYLGLRRGHQPRRPTGSHGGLRISYVGGAAPHGRRLRRGRHRRPRRRPILSYNDWLVALRRHKPGGQVKITFMRNQELEAALATVAGKAEQP